MHEKGSHFIKKCRFLEVFQVPVKQMLLGDIFPNGFSPRSLWCLEKIQGPIWRSKDHLVMKGLSKNVKNQRFSRNPLFGETQNCRRGVYFDAEYVSAPFCHAKTPWIAIWGKTKKCCLENKFFSFWNCWPYRMPKIYCWTMRVLTNCENSIPKNSGECTRFESR